MWNLDIKNYNFLHNVEWHDIFLSYKINIKQMFEFPCPSFALFNYEIEFFANAEYTTTYKNLLHRRCNIWHHMSLTRMNDKHDL